MQTAADVGKLDLRVTVGWAKDRPGPRHEGRTVDFGQSSTGRWLVSRLFVELTELAVCARPLPELAFRKFQSAGPREQIDPP